MTEVNQRLPQSLNCKTAGLTYSVCAILSVLLSTIVSSVFIAANVGRETEVYKYISFLVAPVALCAGCFGVLAFTKTPVKEVVNVRCSPLYYALAALLTFGLLFSASKLNPLFVELFKLWGYTPKGVPLPSTDGALILPVLLVVAVIPAVAEEFFIRGIVFNGAEKGVGTIRAVLISGFLFSLFHASPEQTVYQFVCGCAFALLASRAGSILPCVFAHFSNNALIIILTTFGVLNEDGFVADRTADIVLTVLAAVALAAAILILIFNKKAIARRQKGQTAELFLYAAAGIALLAALWIAAMFSSSL